MRVFTWVFAIFAVFLVLTRNVYSKSGCSISPELRNITFQIFDEVRGKLAGHWLSVKKIAKEPKESWFCLWKNQEKTSKLFCWGSFSFVKVMIVFVFLGLWWHNHFFFFFFFSLLCMTSLVPLTHVITKIQSAVPPETPQIDQISLFHRWKPILLHRRSAQLLAHLQNQP